MIESMIRAVGFLLVLSLCAPVWANSFVFATDESYTELSVYKCLMRFMTDVFSPLGLKTEYRPMPVKRGSQMVAAGKMDGQLFAEKNYAAQFPDLVISRFPYATLTIKMVRLKDRTDVTPGSLHKFRGAVYLNSPVYKKLAEQKSLILKEVPKYSQALQMVFQGRVDYLLEVAPAVPSILQSLPEKEARLLVTEDMNLPPVPVYLLVHRKHKKLLAKIEERLKVVLSGDLSRYPEIQSSLNTQVEK